MGNGGISGEFVRTHSSSERVTFAWFGAIQEWAQLFSMSYIKRKIGCLTNR